LRPVMYDYSVVVDQVVVFCEACCTNGEDRTTTDEDKAPPAANTRGTILQRAAAGAVDASVEDNVPDQQCQQKSIVETAATREWNEIEKERLEKRLIDLARLAKMNQEKKKKLAAQQQMVRQRKKQGILLSLKMQHLVMMKWKKSRQHNL